MGNKHKVTIIKNKRLSDYIYSSAKSLFNIYKNWATYKIT